MNKRAKKVQKRNAKKKAVQKKINRIAEMERLYLKESKRHQSMLTKSIIIDILTTDLDESNEDTILYFETLERELEVNFDKVKNKPAAFQIEMFEDGINYKTSAWYEVFVRELMNKYGEEDKQARERAWKIATGVMSCMVSASEIVLSEPELFYS
ncbi:hypothetical protein ACN08S_00010 (plasmid) [Photobacterium leiognathi subsp. mandapamensis]|uniref:hypothetical protein n=1 Tax=Photobacterium leiognathi TaxID=553611 RepID=UPI003AF3EB7F